MPSLVEQIRDKRADDLLQNQKSYVDLLRKNEPIDLKQAEKILVKLNKSADDIQADIETIAQADALKAKADKLPEGREAAGLASQAANEFDRRYRKTFEDLQKEGEGIRGKHLSTTGYVRELDNARVQLCDLKRKYPELFPDGA
ncbi:MAG: hypothetical protein WC975_06565 [Phycisphaerae bacterium]